MSSSNSFNTCPRCANSNSLNAKYCSRCGAQLKVPSEAVVCHKCHTRNSSLANFCRNCGATLKVGAQTKICPRCGREIGAEENMCACGYSFVTLQQTEPRRADVSSTNKESKKDKKRDKGRRSDEQAYVAGTAQVANSQTQSGKKPKQKKSGRGFALFAFLFLAAFVVLIILPANARGPLTGIDKGIFQPVTNGEPTSLIANQAPQLFADGDEDNNADGTETTPPPATDDNGQDENPDNTGNTDNTDNTGNTGNPDDTNHDNDKPAGTIEQNVYGWDLINKIIGLFSEDTKTAMGSYEGGAFKYIMNEYFGMSTFIVVAMFALFIVTAVFHLLVCLARIISPKRSKHANMLYLVLAFITTILVALMFISQMSAIPEGNFKAFFAPTFDGQSCAYGWVIILIPVYYWFFWLYSCIAKKKSPKKSKKDDKGNK